MESDRAVWLATGLFVALVFLDAWRPGGLVGWVLVVVHLLVIFFWILVLRRRFLR